MWVFGKRGFLSIVKHRDLPGHFIVRGRVKGDIEEYFPGWEVIVDGGTDYKYRTIVPKFSVAAVLFNEIMDIDYDNFKATIKEPTRHEFYLRVWMDMLQMQQTME